MIENKIIIKLGSESEDSNKTIFQSTSNWEGDGVNLVLYKNGVLQTKPDDYLVLNSNTIQFINSVSDTDQISFMISTLSIDVRSQIDRVYKKLENKAQTSIDKKVYEESISTQQIIHGDDIWTSIIDQDPSITIADGNAIYYDKLVLTEDLTVANHKAWFASVDGTMNGRIERWIPPRFGQNYFIRLYDSNNNEIMSSDSMNWRWDYHSGVLFIENDFTYSKPLKVSGYKYTGSMGAGGSGVYWRPPVPNESALPASGNFDGDIRVTLDNNLLWRWNSTQSEWVSAASGNYKPEVATNSDLPITENRIGDIRLVVDEKSLYRWDGSSWTALHYAHNHDDRYYTESEISNILTNYALTIHNHDSRYYIKTEVDSMVRWRPSVATQADLPPHTENEDGDVILTRDTSTIWRWVEEDPITSQGQWIDLVSMNVWWKFPVNTFNDLPTQDNTVGFVHLVLDEQKPYFWDGAQWLELRPADHNHDDRYYTESEVDSMIRWKTPVANYSLLPTTNNEDGDVRLTTDTNSIYKWDTNQWIIISASPRWREPVATIGDLPVNNNSPNDVRLVIDTLLLYRWNENNNTWDLVGIRPHDHDDRYYTKTQLDGGQLDNRYYTENEIDNLFNTSTGHDHDGVNSKKIDYNNLLNIPYIYWKNPVLLKDDLPNNNNTEGDARVVLNENSIYIWKDGDWISVSGNVPDNYDDLYYRKWQVDNLLNSLQAWTTSQLALKADLDHNHDDRYYTESEIDGMFDPLTGHDHDGVNSKRISYYDLVDIPPPAAHNHDDRYYTKTQLQNSGQAIVDWGNIVNAPNFAGQWKTPVQSVSDLPLTGNTDHDIRVVLDDSDVYEWDESTSSWNFVGHWDFNVGYWKSPVDAYSDLPITSFNVDGDIRLVKNENNLYRWDSNFQRWIIVSLTNDRIYQVYLNGINLLENIEFIKIKSNTIELIVPAKANDNVSLVILGNNYYARYDFVAYEDQTLFTANDQYIREDHIINTENTDLTLNNTYNMGSGDLIVWLNGLVQKKDEDYIELHANSIRFANQLHIDDRIIILITGVASGTGNYVREDLNPAAVQRDISLNNAYSVGNNNLLVYLNGDLLKVNEDYEEISASMIRMAYEVDPEDKFTFLIFDKSFGETKDCCNAANNILGVPTDSSWLDGLITWWDSQYKVNDAIDDINEVLKEIAPSPPLTFDGRDLIPDGLDFYSGYESDGNINYEENPGDYHTYLTENSNFRLFTPNSDSFASADRGILNLYINGVKVDSFNLYNAFVENDASSAQTALNYGNEANGARANEGTMGTEGAIRNSVNGLISIMNISKYNNFTMWQVGTARINITPGTLRQGYNYIYLTHDIGTSVSSTNVLKLFYDNAGTRPALGSQITLNEQSLISNKYLSGVRYYDIGDEFSVTFNGHELFNNTYSQVPVTLEMPGLKKYDVAFDNSNVSGLSNPIAIGDVMSFNGILDLDDFDIYNIDSRMTIKTKDPFGDGEERTTMSVNRLVNTYSNGSTDLIEYFRDEKYRLPPGNYDTLPINRLYQWDSQALLTNGNALVFDKKLKYPNIDFRFGFYLPGDQLANYSNFSGPQVYYRSFYKNYPHNSGQIKIDGLNESQLRNGSLKIEIKLPSQTGWLDLSKDYDVSTFAGLDGDGCLLNVENSIFRYSSGTFSTANSQYMIIMRITLLDSSAIEISKIEVLW